MTEIKTKLNREVFTSLVLSQSASKSRIQSIWREFDERFYAYKSRHGKVATLNLYKECYIFLRNYLLGLEYPTPPFTKTDRRGIPKPLWPLRPLIKGDKNAQRIALTISRIWESIYLDPEPKISPIISDRRRNLSTEYMDKTFELWIKDILPTVSWLKVSSWRKEFKVWDSNSSGPNGPAVTWALSDLIPLRKCPELWKSIQQINTAYNRQTLNVMMNALTPDTNLENQDRWVHSRIGLTPEPGGKTRLFSIFDYWSQSALIPIHHQLMKLLRKIHQDATHDQNASFKTLIKRSAGYTCFCFDLTSASDRIPAFQQKLILSELLGEEIAQAWYTVMTDRTFSLPDKTTIRWKVGQPLGALSSFPAFALWHHMVVQFSYHLELWEDAHKSKKDLTGKLPWFKDYMLLGDDIVIWNERVALRYQQVMDDLGLEINLTKTILGRSDSQLEFLKRISKNGSEMSSLKHTIMSKGSPAFAVDLIDLMYERDFIQAVDLKYDKWKNDLPKGKVFDLFKIIIWNRYLDCPSISIERKGNNPLVIERSLFEQKLKEVRQTILMEKTALIDEMLTNNVDLLSLYEKWGAPYRKGTLGEGSLTTNLSPIVWVINHQGEILGETLSRIWEPELIESVEYMPVISNKRYFKKSMDKNIFLSKIYKKAFEEIQDRDAD